MNVTRLGTHPIGPGCAPYFVAELGPNFVVGRDREANVAHLVRMIDAAAEAGVDCVKLQLKSLDGFYLGDDLTRPPHDAARAPFSTRGEYVEAREPDAAMLGVVHRRCEALGIDWTASVWDASSVELLRGFRRPWVKVASACVSDLPLLERVRSLGVPVVLSTGMSTLEEVDRAVMMIGQSNAVLAHCTAAYPCDLVDANLAVMSTLRSRYHVPVGWSSHCTSPSAAGLAAALGACWIEYHVTLDRDAWGPDHASSLEPDELAQAVAAARAGFRAVGSGEKRVLDIEEPARARLRRVGR